VVDPGCDSLARGANVGVVFKTRRRRRKFCAGGAAEGIVELRQIGGEYEELFRKKPTPETKKARIFRSGLFGLAAC
jgi:hypothetical protein